MLVWINGAFGAGKTTLAAELKSRLPDALDYDPEYVGYLLTKWVPAPESRDFQDLPLWRRMVAEFALGLWEEYKRPLIVPMTLVNARYRDEIFTALRTAGVPMLHVFLEVPADELRRRIVEQEIIDGAPQSEDSRRFRLGNVDRCVAARADLPPDTLVLDAHRHAPEELADRVQARI
jgi:thymidylate kinase